MFVQALWLNIPLMFIAFGLWVGIPLWIVARYPDRHPRLSRAVPAYLRGQLRVPRQRQPSPIKVRAYDGQRGIMSM